MFGDSPIAIAAAAEVIDISLDHGEARINKQTSG
jgi:hypothetical protein